MTQKVGRDREPQPTASMNIAPPPTPAISPDLLARFIALVGDRYAVTDPEEQEKYLVEGRNLYRGTSPLILRPRALNDVTAILRLPNAPRTPPAPQDANTALSASP